MSLLIVLVLAFVFVIIINPGGGNSPNQEPLNSQNSTKNNIKHSTASPQAGNYLDYTSELASQSSGTTILFFHAPWCPQCRELEKSIKNSPIPSEVTILKVDYDSNQDLRKKYGVTRQTTLVKIDNQGKEIKKFVAYDDPSLEALIKNLL